MDERFLPCTVANPRGTRQQAGLIAGGNFSFPSEIASRSFPTPQNFAGYYATSDYNAAMFLAHELASPELDMSPSEAQESLQLLRSLIRNLGTAANVSVEALKELQKAAQSIPEIGDLMFSPANLPGTLVSAGTSVAAFSKSKSVVDLLDLSAADKKKLIKWANSRGTASSTSAKKAFKGRIKLIRVAGQLHFEVPITAQAQSYKVLGQVGGQVAHLPAYGTKGALNQRAMLHAEGATRGLKFMTGNTVGIALAVGPQAYFDYTSSASMDEFYRKSVYSQPTNIASFTAGAAVSIVLGSLVGAPLVVVLLVGWGFGVGVQAYMSETGTGKKIGDYWTK
ncbi:hypothetical protein C1886_21265 [Pseudomonas sp. FW300-N1A1]|uniref:hypothetical protein n=1 Tax=Pseudomonas sp. FW300-N1A1 TaxID=2075555 RepID=UPI000CD1B40F|nr:hypothetical protein [Pseudomonas sp. FW300-N1A1]POA17584.1 hypothetical protein C1886_21265 [Pseudomonas sp. FW300-N1A1]